MGVTIRGSWAVLVLGVSLGSLSIAHFWREINELQRVLTPAVILALNLVLAGGVLYAGWQLRQREMAESAEWRIAVYVLGGFVAFSFLEILTLSIQFVEGRPVGKPFLDVLLFGLIGCLGGYTIGIKTDTLRKRETELERENDRLESVAKVVAHDLRNPLTVVSGKVELADRETETDHLDDVQMHLDRMDTIIEEVLTISRAEGASLERDEIDLARLADRCWTGVPTDAATLDVQTDQTILADEAKLQQIFENLLRNAVEHGGSDVTVTVGDLDDGFYVEDTGRGISSGERTKVFETEYSSDEDGTGLGQVVVEQNVRAHGWSINVTEGSDGGARFEISGIEAT